MPSAIILHLFNFKIFDINLLVYKLIFSLILILFLVPDAFAQSTKVTASVGKYYLSARGYVSPFASIVMSSNSIFMGSTVADQKGNFSIERVLVNEGFTDFCLEVVDVKRIGDSFTCFKIPPAVGDTQKDNIFLPPTIGLSGKKIMPGSSVFASGYSMPNAKVLINISEDIILQTTANASGFYKLEIKNLPIGKYSLFASARYENRDSEKPDKKLELQSLSLAQLIGQNLLLILLILLLVIAALIPVIILLSKRLRKRLKELIDRKPFSKKKKLVPAHHSWFLGD